MKRILLTLILAMPLSAFAQNQLTLNAYESTTPTIRFLDAKKNVVIKTDGPPTWSVDKPGIVTLTCATDGLSCKIAWAAPGSCVITVKADANMSPNVVKEISGTIFITTLDAEATTIEITIPPPVLDIAVISGVKELVAKATDDSGVGEFRLELDKTQIGDAIKNPPEEFPIQLDTTLITNGIHELQGVAIDIYGNEGRSEILKVKVQN